MSRALRRLGAAILLVGGLYLLATVLLPLIPGPRVADAPGTGYRLGLIAGPIHYDLLVPLTPAVRARLTFASAAGVPVDDPAAEWLLLGQGGRTFYTTVGTYADLTAAAVLKGAVGDATVVRLDAVGPVRQDVGIRWLEIGPQGLDRLMDMIDASLAPGAGALPLPAPGFTATDRFFPGTGRADLVRTCNAWVGRALRAAGYRFGLWTPATWSVNLSLWRFGPG